MLLASTEIERIYFTVAANDSPAIPFYTDTPVPLPHHHRLMHATLELNYMLYISATSESSILQKATCERVTSVDIRWQ
jgi:hypothetical protein